MGQPLFSRYYNDYWTKRDGWTPHPSLSPLKRKLFSRFVTPQMVVLDVGCGDGAHYGEWLATLARAYYGLDISDAALQVARQHNIRAQCHDLQSSFPFPDETFDTVLCIGVLEHVLNPSYTLGEIRRVLKSTGYAILSVPNIAHLSNRIRLALGKFSPGGTPETSSRRPWADPHIRFFTVSSLRAFVAEEHLQLIALYGEGFSLFSTLPIFSQLLVRLVGSWERLDRWSQPLEFMAHWYPSIFAGQLLAVVRRGDVSST